MKECSKCNRCYDDDKQVCSKDQTPLTPTMSMNSVIDGRYTLIKRLGKGGMGVVFKARHNFLKTSHAIKIILPDLVEDDESLLIRFKQEAVLSASINHPNIINVTDFGVENSSTPYLVMEYIDGFPLSDYLEKHKKLDIDRTIGFFKPIAFAIAAAHQQGIVHRDLKPQNIMIKKNLPLNEAIKVLDFGLAKIKSPDSFGSLVQAKTLSVIGSPPYMAPEQWESGEVSYRTDIYALGVLLFQLLTGRVPFVGENVPQIMFQHMTADPPTFESISTNIPTKLEETVRKALEKKSESRYQSVEEMLSAIDTAVVSLDKSDLKENTSNLNTNKDFSVSQFKIPKPSDSIEHLVTNTDEVKNFNTIADTNNVKPTEQSFLIDSVKTENVNAEDESPIQESFSISQETLVNESRKNKPQNVVISTEETSREKSKSILPQILIGLSGFSVLLLLFGAIGSYFIFWKGGDTTSKNSNTNQEQTTPKKSTKERILIDGGEFNMGRDDVPPTDPIWGVQYPSHIVSVEPFQIDKAETTNEEYLEFVKATNHTPPSNWTNNAPPKGAEKLPVTFVSLEDVKKYAIWVSKRDDKQCRLPTEQEWEFAAKNGASQTTYPWGNEWSFEFANIGSGKPKDVNTSKDKTLENSISDMLGNVIEWTSSAESLYPGHPSKLNKTEETLYVVRGSSWGETQKNIERSKWLLTRRQFVQAEQKSPYLGFRLVCSHNTSDSFDK